MEASSPSIHHSRAAAMLERTVGEVWRRHLGLDRVVLGGLSFGGFLALATWAAAPERR